MDKDALIAALMGNGQQSATADRQSWMNMMDGATMTPQSMPSQEQMMQMMAPNGGGQVIPQDPRLSAPESYLGNKGWQVLEQLGKYVGGPIGRQVAGNAQGNQAQYISDVVPRRPY